MSVSCNHCFHGTGTANCGLPASYEEKCCHCGHVRWYQPTWPASAQHGPYAPPTYTLTYGTNTGDAQLDAFFGAKPRPDYVPGMDSKCRKEAMASGAVAIPKSCYICGHAPVCPVGKT